MFQSLLGIGLKRSSRFKQAINSGCEGVKPGWVRMNFNYFISEQAFDFMIEAVRLIAAHGWKLLPQYEFLAETGEWRHCRPADDTGLEVSFRHGIETVPTLIRAAAKNFARVIVVTEPDQYSLVLKELKEGDGVSAGTRRTLANLAFIHTADYDAAISEYLNQ